MNIQNNGLWLTLLCIPVCLLAAGARSEPRIDSFMQWKRSHPALSALTFCTLKTGLQLAIDDPMYKKLEAFKPKMTDALSPSSADLADDFRYARSVSHKVALWGEYKLGCDLARDTSEQLISSVGSLYGLAANQVALGLYGGSITGAQQKPKPASYNYSGYFIRASVFQAGVTIASGTTHRALHACRAPEVVHKWAQNGALTISLVAQEREWYWNEGPLAPYPVLGINVAPALSIVAPMTGQMAGVGILKLFGL